MSLESYIERNKEQAMSLALAADGLSGWLSAIKKEYGSLKTIKNDTYVSLKSHYSERLFAVTLSGKGDLVIGVRKMAGLEFLQSIKAVWIDSQSTESRATATLRLKAPVENSPSIFITFNISKGIQELIEASDIVFVVFYETANGNVIFEKKALSKINKRIKP